MGILREAIISSTETRRPRNVRSEKGHPTSKIIYTSVSVFRALDQASHGSHYITCVKKLVSGQITLKKSYILHSRIQFPHISNENNSRAFLKIYKVIHTKCSEPR